MNQAPKAVPSVPTVEAMDAISQPMKISLLRQRLSQFLNITLLEEPK